MKRPEKEAVVAQLTDKFRNADAIYLTEYRGLTVPQISELREKLGRDTSYTVAKSPVRAVCRREVRQHRGRAKPAFSKALPASLHRLGLIGKIIFYSCRAGNCRATCGRAVASLTASDSVSWRAAPEREFLYDAGYTRLRIDNDSQFRL